MDEVKEQMLRYNSSIKIAGEIISYKAWFQQGIIQVKDIMSGQGFLSAEEFIRRFPDLPFIEYTGIVSTIPKEWKQIIYQNHTEEGTASNQEALIINPKASQVIYPKLCTRQELIIMKKISWNRLLGGEDDDILIRSPTNILKLTISVK